MRNRHDRDRSQAQRALRHERGEKAFVFDKDVTHYIGEFDRDAWERAISACGGDVAAAARACGNDGVPRGAKALWGRTSDEALAIYKRWQKQRGGR